VAAWTKPILDAFLAGCWYLYWTADTLYWVAKPTLHKDPTPNTRRLHCETGPAVESDIEHLYFWRGVLVPSFVVVTPERITLAHIQTEANAEVRRVMLDRFGFDRYLSKSGAVPVHADDCGTLYRIDLGGETLAMVSVLNSTPEADGTPKRYVIPVDPACQTARAAVASSFGLTATQYQPSQES